MMFFISETALSEAIVTLLPFALPGSLLLAFLVLTVKDHNKLWVIKQQNDKTRRK